MRRAGQHHRDALAAGIKRVLKVDTTLDGVATSGMLDRDLIAVMLRAAGVSATTVRANLTRIMLETTLCYERDCPTDLRQCLCPGVPELLETLRSRGAACGVVSGNLAAIGWKKLALAGIGGCFSVAGFAEDGRTRARLAQVAVWRARRLGLIGVGAKVTVIGDHFNDIEAGRRNGFQTVAVGTGLTPVEELAGADPDIVVSDLTHLNIDALL